MNIFDQSNDRYLHAAQMAENVHADVAGREPKKIDIDQPISLRVLAELLRNPKGFGLES